MTRATAIWALHVHGLMAAVLASLSTEAGVICTDGVYARRFFARMREFPWKLQGADFRG